MKTTLRAMVLALLLFQLVAPRVGAMEEWCEDDPPVLIRTPAGNLVLVYVTNGARGVQHLAAAQLAHITYTVRPANGGRETLVTLQVTVPGDVFSRSFATRTTVSTGPFKTGSVYGAAVGTATQPMVVSFQLNRP